MLKPWHKIILLFFMIAGISMPASPLCALQGSNETAVSTYLDKNKLVSQQMELLKNRLTQAHNQLKNLQSQQANLFNTVLPGRLTKRLLTQTSFDIAMAKSNFNTISIELAESQQAVNNLGKSVQALHNQINIFNMFGLKNTHNGAGDLTRLRAEAGYQKDLLKLEKIRVAYLLKLQQYADAMVQLYVAKYEKMDTLLKAQTITYLKEQQTKSELALQHTQAVWLKRLDDLNAALKQLSPSKENDQKYNQLQNAIFFANEHINLTYLKMLIARYENQLQQMKIDMAHSTSITLLNKTTDQVQLLNKQLNRMRSLVTERIHILSKRGLTAMDMSQPIPSDQTQFDDLLSQYRSVLSQLTDIAQKLAQFRQTLDQVLKQELSSRQGLPGLGAKAWMDLGGELLLIPTLTFQVVKSLSHNVMHGFFKISLGGWLFLFILECAWVMLFFGLHYLIKKMLIGISDHALGHISLKWLTVQLVDRTLMDIGLIINLIGLFFYLNLPWANFSFLVALGAVWLFFKMIMTVVRLCLIETVANREGRDVRLYYQLKRILFIGAIVTALSVLIHQLPMIYEVKDLFDRLFLVFLLISSIFLLKEWELAPGLFLPHIDERRTYLKRVVRLLGILIPLILLINSLIGLLGFVNLIQTISWYESIFMLVLVGYLVIRGVLNELMELVSKVFIRHMSNGWLWTEAFLKPIDNVLRVILFLTAWAILFLFYGWDEQSPVVERLNSLLHYRLLDLLTITITPISMIELIVLVSLLYWAVKWTREFVYRMLLSRTKDIGLRNSIAILSQYAMTVIGLFICLHLLGIKLQALAFVATAFAFGAGLGLRDLINNFACGFLLLIERPLRVGDTVSISGYDGEVTHIGGRAITLCTFDHMDVIVPNAEIFSKSFTNWTGRDNVVRSVVSIKINRQDNPEKVQALIYQVIEMHKEVLKDPIPEVFLKELSDGMIEFEIRYFINLRLVKSRLGVRSEILMSIWDAFKEHGIETPYPHQEVFVKSSHL